MFSDPLSAELNHRRFQSILLDDQMTVIGNEMRVLTLSDLKMH